MVATRCGGQGRLSELTLRCLRTGRVKFSAKLSPWRAALSVAEKQLGQHGRRGMVTRGVAGSDEDVTPVVVLARLRWLREGGGRDERRWMDGGGELLLALRLNFLERLCGTICQSNKYVLEMRRCLRGSGRDWCLRSVIVTRRCWRWRMGALWRVSSLEYE